MNEANILYLFGPPWKDPFGAQEPLRMKNTILNLSVQNIDCHHIWVHGIGIFSPCSLCHSFPGMAVKCIQVLKVLGNVRNVASVRQIEQKILGVVCTHYKVIRAEETGIIA